MDGANAISDIAMALAVEPERSSGHVLRNSALKRGYMCWTNAKDLPMRLQAASAIVALSSAAFSFLPLRASLACSRDPCLNLRQGGSPN